MEIHGNKYPFPRGRGALELVPDHRSTFGLRLLWQRGKTARTLLETTPLRPLAEVVYGSQRFPLALTGHARERRHSVHVWAERLAGSDKALLCGDLRVAGRGDRLRWEWRMTARSQATRRLLSGVAEVTLRLPLPPGPREILTPPATVPGLAVWRDGIVMTVVAIAPLNENSDKPLPALTLNTDAQGVCVSFPPAPLKAAPIIYLETWLAPAATRQDAQNLLLEHLADAADPTQPTVSLPHLSLNRRAEAACQTLMAPDRTDKRGPDRLVLRTAPGSPARHLNGEGADTALIAQTLYNTFRQNGDDALRRQALLLARGVCEFAITSEESPHRGAFWDALRAKKHFEDVGGGHTLSLATTARAAWGLWWMHGRFGQEVMHRTAITAAQWLMLRMDRSGGFAGERYHADGPPIEGGGSPWGMAEALRPFVETFRRTNNEVFLKAALRSVAHLQEALADGRDDGPLSLGEATAEHLATAIEGVLWVSRESENSEMVFLARRMGWALRARRRRDGSLPGPDKNNDASSPHVTLAGARAALALARVDPDPVWPLFALHALRWAAALDPATLSLAEQNALCALPTELLLTLAARAPQCAADRDALTITRGWQVFEPDPSTRQFVRVEAEIGATVDYLALVCPANLQVLLVALAGPDVGEVSICKSGRTPFVQNLLTGDYDQAARLVPLGDGKTAHFGVFLADT